MGNAGVFICEMNMKPKFVYVRPTAKRGITKSRTWYDKINCKVLSKLVNLKVREHEKQTFEKTCPILENMIKYFHGRYCVSLMKVIQYVA